MDKETYKKRFMSENPIRESRPEAWSLPRESRVELGTTEYSVLQSTLATSATLFSILSPALCLHGPVDAKATYHVFFIERKAGAYKARQIHNPFSFRLSKVKC